MDEGDITPDATADTNQISLRSKLYMRISDNLSKSQVKDMRALLVRDGHIGLARVEKARPLEIFNMLEDEDKIGEGRLALLIEVLKSLKKTKLSKEAEEVQRKEGEPSLSPAASVSTEKRKRPSAEPVHSTPCGKHFKPSFTHHGITSDHGLECTSSTSSNDRSPEETNAACLQTESGHASPSDEDEIEYFSDIPFHGRHDQLNKIQQKFKDGCRIGLISGMPGVGKSRLAKEAALQISMEWQEQKISLKRHNHDVNSFKTTDMIIDTVFASLLQEAFPGAVSTPESLFKALDEVRHVKDFHLFIFDNADTILENDNLRTELLDVICRTVQATSQVFFLITSCRKFRLAKEQLIFFDIHLPPLHHSEATDLLMAIAPDVPPNHAAEIADLCGRLPLALVIAGNELRSGEGEGYTPEELIELLSSVMESPLSDEGYSKSEQVDSVLSSAVQKLTDVLKEHYAELNFIPGSFSTKAAAAVTGKESTAIVKAHALRPLHQRSLLEFDDSQKRWDIHRLLRKLVQSSLSSHLDLGVIRPRFCIFFADALKTIGEAMTKDASQGLWALTAEYRNIEKMMLEAINCSDDNAYRVFIDAAFEGEKVLMQYLRDPSRTTPFYMACLNSAMICGTVEERARLLTILGFAIGNYQGRYEEAYKKYMRAKEMLEPLGESTTLARLYSNIGYVYHTRGQHQEAVSSLEESLEMWGRLKRGPHLGKALTLATLGIVHSFVGNYAKARDCHARCLEMRIEMCGEDHPLIGPTQNNLAITYDKLGDRDNALELHRRALDMKRRWFKKPAQTKVDSLNNVAEQYMYRKDYNRALQYLQEAAEMQKQVGDGDEESARSNVNLGKVFLYTERYTEAEEQFRLAADWYEGRWGVHVWTAEALEFRGMALRGLGKHGKAKDTLARALDMYEKVSGNVGVDEAIPRTRALLEEITIITAGNTTASLSMKSRPGREQGDNEGATGSDSVEDNDMQAVFTAISAETGYRWPDLARKLGQTEAQIQDVESKHRGDLKESCMDVLKTWQKEGANVSIPLLKEALEGACLKAIAENIEGTAEEKVVAVNQKLQAVFCTIAEDTGSKWKDLARKLDMTPAQIDSVETRHPTEIKECCMDVLETWRLREGGTATVWALQQALREADLVALADEVG